MTSQPLKIAVLKGGYAAEAEVSRNSAREVNNALLEAGHNSQCIELDDQCAANLLKMTPDVVFPALHGPPGEDGTVQGFLEIMQLAYVGSSVRGSALAMDKALAKSIFRKAGLPILGGHVVSSTDNLEQSAANIIDELGPRLALKPLNQGSAIGVQLLPNGGDLPSALAAVLEYGPALVEPFVMGREITVGVLQHDRVAVTDKPSYEVHPVIEIVTASGEWYDYTNRYAAGKSDHIIPAALSNECTSAIQAIAVQAHIELGLKDLSRADFIVTDNEEIYLLEVNTLPGMTPTSLYPDGARYLGYSFPELLDLLVKQAYQRHHRKPGV
ncbi:MAG: D-alanine--D-alanine ligase [Pseudomonadota bacterium]